MIKAMAGKKLGCGALNQSLFLDPEGNLYPCVILNEKICNVKEQSYDLGKCIESAGEKITKKTRECNLFCWTPCEANQAMLANLPKMIWSALK